MEGPFWHPCAPGIQLIAFFLREFAQCNKYCGRAGVAGCRIFVNKSLCTITEREVQFSAERNQLLRLGSRRIARTSLMKILIAEDNHLYRLALQATLEEWGYEVIAVADGLAAFEVLIGEDAPRLAILDWMMPGLEGTEVCRRIRALHKPEPPYLIVLTSKDSKENMVAALESGADDHIVKPFDRAELKARLRVGLRIV